MATINNNLTQEQKTGIDNADTTKGVVDLNILETTPDKLPEQPVAPDNSVTTATVGTTIGEQAQIDRQKADELANETARIQAEQKKKEARLAILESGVIGQDIAETKAFQNAGLSESQKAIDDLNYAILASSTSLKQQKVQDDLQVKELEGRGLGIPIGIVRGQQALLAQQLKAKRDSQALEIENDIATSALLQGKFENAQKAIERKIALQFADKKLELQQEKDWLSRTDKKLSEAKDKELKAINKAEQEVKDIFNIASQARQAGAGQKEISAIMASKDKAEALQNAGSLGADSRLNRYKTNLEINKIKAEINAENAKADGIKYNPDSEFKVGTPENVVAWMTKSASSDKNITPGQQEAITQGLRALDSVENLNKILFDGNDPLSTGRTAGAWRKIQAKVKEDISTKEMEALIIGLIPTAARGLFGEVGVLTDTDVERYKQLVANSNNTQEENSAIQSILMDVAVQSVGITLETAARSNQNVSGFTGRYIDTVDRVEKQKELIGTAKINQLSNEELIKNTSKDYKIPDNVISTSQKGLDFINSIKQ